MNFLDRTLMMVVADQRSILSILPYVYNVLRYYVGKKPIVMVVEPDMIGDITVKEFRHFKDRMEVMII